MVEMNENLNQKMDLHTDGCLMLFRKEATRIHEQHLCQEAKQYNIETKMLTQSELREFEPTHNIQALGAAYYPIDCHINPMQTMAALQEYCIAKGVKICYETEVSDFETKDNKVVTIKANLGDHHCDQLILANGSWLPITAKQLKLPLLLQPGKGYSVTYSNIANNINYPAILVDDRVAMTPMGDSLRVGGTMELSGYNHHINSKRVRPIIQAANDHYSELNLEMPSIQNIWAGLRPCSPDGLPYIGRSPKHSNVVIAGGHAMIGISLAGGTGKIVADLIDTKETDIPIHAFAVDRF
jgi:D-amino-acid dehydrogenase